MYQAHRMYNTEANPKINDGLWVIMMSSYSFIFGEKCAIFGSDAVNEGYYACVRAEGIFESLCVSFNFFVDL